jgi:hypothetical protein
MTGLDTVYEYAGYTLAEAVRSVLSALGLPLLLGLAGTAWLVHQLASERASARQLGVHVLYLILAAWMLGPSRQGEATAPRLVLWAGQAADLVQARAIRSIHRRFLEAPYAWERLAALASFATVVDPVLKKDVAAFLEGCATPALARAEPSGPNLLAEGALPYDDACARRRAELRIRIARHVESDPVHREALTAASQQDPAGAAGFRERYEEEICRRIVDDPDSPTGEAALVAASLGAYSYTSAAQSTGDFPLWMKPVVGLIPGVGRLWDAGANAAITGVAELQQSWDNRFTAKQKYFLVTVYGPHLYGLALLFLLGLFPIAGLWALLPGKWTALAGWAQVFLSVKLWPVCWAALTTFNEKRAAVEAFDPGPRGAGDVFGAVASMYLLTPAISFLMVHLGAKAAAMPFSPAVPPPSGPGLGAAGVAVNVAARLAK